MKFLKRRPSLKLQPYIRHYWLLEIEAADVPYRQLFFPFGFHEFIFNQRSVPCMQYLQPGSVFAQPHSFYAGQFTRPFQLSYDMPCRCLGVSMQPWAGNLLFDAPSYSFTDQVQDLGCDKNFNEWNNGTLQPEEHEQLFARIDNFFERWLTAATPDAVAVEIATRLISDPARKNLHGTLESIGLSRRRVEQRFLENVGLSIGAFVRKVRFQKAVGLLRSGVHGENLTGVGLEAGYYDQSHFISDFKEFSGTTPRNFVRQQSEMQDFLRSLLAR